MHYRCFDLFLTVLVLLSIIGTVGFKVNSRKTPSSLCHKGCVMSYVVIHVGKINDPFKSLSDRKVFEFGVLFGAHLQFGCKSSVHVKLCM